MTKSALKDALQNSFNGLAQQTHSLTEQQFFAPIGEKWSVAENILHLTQSVKALNQGLALPKQVLVQQFGTIERPAFDYDGVVAAYLAVLSTGAVAKGIYVPTLPENPSKEMLLESFVKHHNILAGFLDDWSEQELDEICIRHPVLKLLTIREIYYFMHYHIEHHKKAIMKGL
ncbi:DinB family protein [Emticicia sp. 17c]|uniref:DinB family protein n=1 Tax=Emticicia sp. 17c TaxID=3127704 RepID=UPI00301BC8EA